MPARQDLDDLLLECALEGGRALLAAIRRQDATRTTLKPDGTPVTLADLAADEAVRRAAGRLMPHLPLVSEESACACPEGRFLLLDPLDGTREFLEGGREFCVALACIDKGRPVAGAIVAPLLRVAWKAEAAAWRLALDDDLAIIGEPRRLQLPGRPASPPLALTSRQHGEAATDEALARLAPVDSKVVASAIKFGLMAEGEGDLMIRFGRLKGWDVAAGEAILAAAGGVTIAQDGSVLRYDGSQDWSCPPFIAASCHHLATRAREAVQRPS